MSEYTAKGTDVFSYIISTGLENVEMIDSANPKEEWQETGPRLPKEKHFNVNVEKSSSAVSVTFQAPVDELGLPPIILSPGFTAGETSFKTLHRALANIGYPSFSLSHHRKHDDKYLIQETHALNDLAVMHEAYKLFGYNEFYILGWSMGAGDVVHVPDYANYTEHDMVKGLLLFNGMGQIEGDTFASVALKMAKALAEDARLTAQLPIKQRLFVAQAAFDSFKRAATNLKQTKTEAEYASSFDIRDLISELIKQNLPVYQINSQRDGVFRPQDQFNSTENIAFKKRCVILGEYATHISGLFVPKASAETIRVCLTD